MEKKLQRFSMEKKLGVRVGSYYRGKTGRRRKFTSRKT